MTHKVSIASTTSYSVKQQPDPKIKISTTFGLGSISVKKQPQ